MERGHMPKIIRFINFVCLSIFVFFLSACSIDSSVISRPQVKSVKVNDGDTYLSNALVKLEVTVVDTLRPVKQVGILEVPEGAKCVYDDSSPWNSYSEQATWYSYVEGGSYLYQIKNLGTQKLCIWAMNDLNQKSEIVENDGKGIEGVNTSTVLNDVDSPPDIYNVTLKNANPVSPYYNTETIQAGDLVKITAVIEDGLELPANPLEIYLTLDGTTFSQPTELTSSSLGTPAAGTKKWEFEYSGYTYSSNDPARLKLIATDSSGNKTIRFSNYINGGKWKIYAGDESNGAGGSALSAKLQSAKTLLNAVHMTPSGDLFFLDKTGLLKISQKTGLVETVLKYDAATETGIPGTVTASTRIFTARTMVGDGTDIYILGGLGSGARIYRYNSADESIEIYAGTTASGFSATDPQQLTIWLYGALAIDTENKDVFLINACSSTSATHATDTVKIQKITQDPSTKAASAVVPYAGNCVKSSSIVEGDPLLTPLENISIREQHSGLAYDQENKALYVRFKNQAIYRIQNNQLKILSTSAESLTFNNAEKRLYIVNSADGIANNVFYLDVTQSNPTAQLYIRNESSCVSVSCRENGVEREDAGVEPISLFTYNSRLGIVDGSDTALRLRVVDKLYSKDILLTIAGTDRMSGVGRDPISARFSRIRNIRYVPAVQGAFESGIHFLDGGASYLLRVEHGATRTYLRSVFGSGVARHPSTDTNLTSNNFLGLINLFNFFEIGPTGKIYWNSFRYLMGLDTSNPANKAEFLLSATDLDASQYRISTRLFLGDDPYSGTSAQYEPSQMKAGLRIDSDGNLYMGGLDAGGYGWGASPSNHASVILYRDSAGVYRKIIGTMIAQNTYPGSPVDDCVTPGCAISQRIYCISNSDGAGSCNIGKIDERGATKKLYYSENNKIRVVDNPLDPAQSTLGSLIPGLARHVGAFVYTYVNGTDPDLDRVYYISSDGKLYTCTMQPGPTCSNTALGPDLLGLKLSPSSLEVGPDNKLYMLNENRNQVIEYDPAAP